MGYDIFYGFKLLNFLFHITLSRGEVVSYGCGRYESISPSVLCGSIEWAPIESNFENEPYSIAV